MRARLVRPALTRVAVGGAALKDATRRRWRWPRERTRPSLTTAPPTALRYSGRDEKTALQPNQKTVIAGGRRRTTHALQKADMFMRHEQPGCVDAARIYDSKALSNVASRKASGMPADRRPAKTTSWRRSEVS